ncbi:MAG: type IV secretion system protein [Asticcacaulis sp.]|uniref:type IV secretion system protein n=1 Tax=Asticcacaulis sp. TaxID=1872648 RepID=UPI003F7BD3ED
MSVVCPALSDSAGIAERLASYVECQSQQIDLAAFQGGLWHGLPTALVSVLMVLYVAGFGYRLILSHHIDTASLVYATLRLGVIIAVTTTFGAYSSLIYTVSIQGPSELANMALAPIGLRAPALTEASHTAAGYLDALSGPEQAAPSADSAVSPPVVTPAPGPISGPTPTSAAPPSPVKPAQDKGSALFMLSCVGFGLAARLAQSVVLAVGPLFIAAALFDISTGLFIGWFRGFVALFLAQVGYAVNCALELSFFAHDLEHLTQASSDASDVLLVGFFFLAGGIAITVIALLAASGLVRSRSVQSVGGMMRARTVAETSPHAPASPWRTSSDLRVEAPVSRVQRVTDAVGTMSAGNESRRSDSLGDASASTASRTGGTSEPLASAGQGLRRPGYLRASTGAAKRDMIS